MASPFSPKLIAAGEGKSVALAILADHQPPPEYYRLADEYGLTIQDDWIDELERRHQVRL